MNKLKLNRKPPQTAANSLEPTVFAALGRLRLECGLVRLYRPVKKQAWEGNVQGAGDISNSYVTPRRDHRNRLGVMLRN
jgi:hypothetical protein